MRYAKAPSTACVVEGGIQMEHLRPRFPELSSDIEDGKMGHVAEVLIAGAKAVTYISALVT